MRFHYFRTKPKQAFRLLLGSSRSGALLEAVDPASTVESGLFACIEGVRIARDLDDIERIFLAVYSNNLIGLHGRSDDELRTTTCVLEYNRTEI